MTDPTEFVLDWEQESGRDDPEQRYVLFRLCECIACDGTGKDDAGRCALCRGEGRTREHLGACATEEDFGVMIITLAREGELDGCANGALDRQGKPGRKWLWKPWLPSPRNVSDAGRVLATAPRKRGATSD